MKKNQVGLKTKSQFQNLTPMQSEEESFEYYSQRSPSLGPSPSPQIEKTRDERQARIFGRIPSSQIHNDDKSESDENDKTVLTLIDQYKRMKTVTEFLNFHVISTQTIQYQIWNLYIVTISLVCSHYYAYFAAFREDVDHETHELYLFSTRHQTPFTKEEIQRYAGIQIFFEVSYLIYTMLNFITEYKTFVPTGEDYGIRPVRDVQKIATRYLRGSFGVDFLTLIPFHQIFHFHHSRIFYLIKALRLRSVYQILDTKKFMAQIKGIYQKQLEEDCLDEEIAHDQIDDHVKVNQLETIATGFKLVRVLFIIYMLTYLLALVKHIQAEIIYGWAYYPDIEETFSERFGLYEIKPYQANIRLFYYSFTTLTTVGFGDYYPINNIERVIAALTLIIGVACFSYLMGIFQNIMERYHTINQPIGDDQSLAVFLSTLEVFNKRNPLDPNFKDKILQYFEYKWIMDSNHCISTEEDIAIFSQLPNDVQRRLFTDFIFGNFYSRIKKQFTFLNLTVGNSKSFYTWDDENYETMMIRFFRLLDPIKFEPKEIIYLENEECQSVILLNRGTYDIGYEINRRQKFVTRYQKGSIGQFEAFFDHSFQYCARAYECCEGLFIRKNDWKSLEKEFPQFFSQLKTKSMVFFINEIFTKVNALKKQDIQKLRNRAHVKHIIQLRTDQNLIEQVEEEILREQDQTIKINSQIEREEIENKIALEKFEQSFIQTKYSNMTSARTIMQGYMQRVKLYKQVIQKNSILFKQNELLKQRLRLTNIPDTKPISLQKTSDKIELSEFFDATNVYDQATYDDTFSRFPSRDHRINSVQIYSRENTQLIINRENTLQPSQSMLTAEKINERQIEEEDMILKEFAAQDIFKMSPAERRQIRLEQIKRLRISVQNLRK